MLPTVKLPDILQDWPWKRAINPYYEQCKAESSEWCQSFNAFSHKAQQAFDRCDFNLLAALIYASLDKDGCRIGCHLMNVFFVFDETSDAANGAEVRRLSDIMIDALHHPDCQRPKDEWIGGEMTRQFWSNAIKVVGRAPQERFIDAFREYTDAVVQQAIDRDDENIRDVDSYFKVRRQTIGTIPSFAINEMYLNLPDYVFDCQAIKNIIECSTDMTIIGNDLCSYNVEQARGDDQHNIVTIVMREKELNLQDALNWVGNHCRVQANLFLEELNNIPSWGDTVDSDVSKYVDALGNMPRANYQWSYESERYFGKDGMQVYRNRLVTLLPRNSEIGIAQL